MLCYRTPFHDFKRDTMTGAMYRNAVLNPYDCLFRGEVVPDFNLWMAMLGHMELIWCTTIAYLVYDFLKIEDTRRMYWPARYSSSQILRSYPYRVCGGILSGGLLQLVTSLRESSRF